MPARRSPTERPRTPRAQRGPRLEPLGDAAVWIELGRRVDTALNTRALRLAAALRGRRGIREAMGAYASVTVHYDPDQLSLPGLRKMVVEALGATRGEPLRGRLHRVPVTYDGPDLEAVAATSGLSVEEVVRRHGGPVYRAFMAGFVPGWTYLGPLDPKLALPRLAAPRTSVPAGSVAIAGAQTGVYPLASPGGWHLIGRTTLKTFLSDSDPPLLIRPGDRVKFFPA
jgi:KipI family sensor histidine kinase inhibitor